MYHRKEALRSLYQTHVIRALQPMKRSWHPGTFPAFRFNDSILHVSRQLHKTKKKLFLAN